MITDDEKTRLRKRDGLKKECKLHIIKCNAIIDSLKASPELAVMIESNGLRFGMCNNAAVIRMLKAEITEAKACIAGRPNKYE